MSAISILVTSAGLSSAVRDTLVDWSAAGLIGTCVFVQADEHSRFEGMLLQDGSQRLIDVSALAGGHSRPDSVRVCALVPVLEGWGEDPTDRAQAIASHLEGAFGHSIKVTRVRAVVSREGDEKRSDRVAVEGWHNVLLSAEDSTGPGMGHTSLQKNQKPGEIAIHSAAGIAGVLGLWSGDDTSPFDQLDLLPGANVYLARSFFRHLESSEVERELRVSVLSTGERLPQPLYQGTPTITIDNTELAAREMSQHFWARHAALVTPDREPYPASQVKAVGLWQALKMFFGFLGAAIRNAPGAWAAGLVAKIGSSTAKFVTGAIFGSAPSEYRVVALGMNPDGTPAHWSDFSRSAATIEQSLQQMGLPQEHYVREANSEVWKDYTDAARTLADAAPRSSVMPPVQIGTHYAVMPSAAHIAPGPAAAFDGLPPHLADRFTKGPLAPYDVLEVISLTERLRATTTDSTIGAAASTALQSLEGWKHHYGSTFAVQVGIPIASSLNGAIDETRELWQRLESAENPDDLVLKAQANQKRNAKRMLIIALIFALGIGVSGLLFGLGVLSIGWFIGVALALIVGWLVSSVLSFTRSQQVLFQLINSRKQLVERSDIDRRNLMRALRDIRRLSDAYNQFLAWSRVLGLFLMAPFGQAPAESSSGPSSLTRLPQSVGLGHTVRDENAIAYVAAEVRRGYFNTGWLEAPWRSILAHTQSLLGTRVFELGDNPDGLFAQFANDENSLLRFWVQQLEQHGIPSAVGDTEWQNVVRQLQTIPGAAGRLLGQVELRSDVGSPIITNEAFFGALAGNSVDQLEKMNTDLLTSSAKVSDRARVAMSFPRRNDFGFSSSLCLTQLTQGFPAYEVAAYSETRSTPWWEAEQATQQAVQAANESAAPAPDSSVPTPASPFDGQAF